MYNSQMSPKTRRSRRKAKRFERDADATPIMRLTPRDLDIIRHVARHRFLNSRQIKELVGKSPRIVRRLELLFRCGYLDRPRAQLIYYSKAGSEPLVYALARKGAQILAETDRDSSEAYRWTLKNKRVGQVHVQHTIEAADILVKLASATKATKHMRLVTQDELLAEAPQSTGELTQPFKISADVEWGKRHHRLSVIPDEVFALEFTDGGDVERSYFFLELDRETMPVMRKANSLDKHDRQTSILSKLLTYHRAWRARTHTERFGWENFRVLTVTTSEKRLDSMLEAVDAVTGGRGSSLFLFATGDSASRCSITEIDWTTGKGERARLTD